MCGLRKPRAELGWEPGVGGAALATHPFRPLPPRGLFRGRLRLGRRVARRPEDLAAGKTAPPP